MTLVVGFVGMTHLGLNSMAAAAEKGCHVVGYDPNGQLIEALRVGELPVVEPDLPAVIERNRQAIHFSSRREDLQDCDIVYIAPDVATNDAGESDLTELNALLETVGPHITQDTVIVILSQVPPGFSRLRSGQGKRLYYQVETLIFGRAMERALFPERFIIGCLNPEAPLPEKYKQFLQFYDCPILPMRYESAELAKISINFCLVSQISVANTLAEVCETIGADWSEIIPALRLDARIGPKAYINPGLGIAGGNLERDLATILTLGEKHSIHTDVVSAWVSSSRYRKLWASRILQEKVLPGLEAPCISVWGIAYKENTHSIKNSPSIATMTANPDIAFQAHDPAVPDAAIKLENVCRFQSPLSAIADSDCLMILTPWDDYKFLEVEEIAKVMRGRTIIDPFRVLNQSNAEDAGFEYYALGHGSIMAEQNG